MKRRFLPLGIFCMIAILLIGCGAPSTSPPSVPDSSPNPSTPSPSPTKEIIIKYSSTTMDQIGEWNKADPCYTYLVVSLDIENNGYESFFTNAYFFSVIVTNVKYDPACLMLEDELKSVHLLDGGKISGKLEFEVPKEVTSAKLHS